MLDADRQEKLRLKRELAAAEENNKSLCNQLEAVCLESHRRIGVLNDLLDHQDVLLRAQLEQNFELRRAENLNAPNADVGFARKLVEAQAEKNRALAQQLIADADSFTALAKDIGN